MLFCYPLPEARILTRSGATPDTKPVRVEQPQTISHFAKIDIKKAVVHAGIPNKFSSDVPRSKRHFSKKGLVQMHE